MSEASSNLYRSPWSRALEAVGRPLALTNVETPASLRVMVIGPHPDDFDANGVTLRRFHEQGARIRALVVSGGSGVEDSYCRPPTLEAKARIREREQRESVRFFGLSDDSLVFLDLEQDEDAQPVESPANAEVLAEHIRSFRPEIIFLPHGNDTNQGHRAMYRMLSDVLRHTGSDVEVFLSSDPKTISMRIDLYTPFDEGMAEWKAALLRFHDSQHQRNLNTRGHGFDERILAENRRIARELGLDAPYAEAFELRR